MPVYRIYVSKRPPYDVEAQGLCHNLRHSLQITGLEQIEILNRYDVEDLTREEFDAVRSVVFSEPQVDVTYDSIPDYGPDVRLFAVEYLPGQFDQRADSCAQCISLVTQKERPLVRTAKVYVIKGAVSEEDFDKIKHYLVNPVESREADLRPVETLKTKYDTPTTVEVMEGFVSLDRAGLSDFLERYGLAMDLDDVAFCQEYFLRY